MADSKTTFLQGELRRGGYSEEDEYFYSENRELIKQRRVDLDRQRAALHDAKEKTLHWMKCPKCGHTMAELNHAGILLDQCTKCQGVYMDQGELETVLETKSAEHFWKGLWKRLGQRLQKGDTDWVP